MQAVQRRWVLISLLICLVPLSGCIRDRIHQPPPHGLPALVDFTPIIEPSGPKKPYIKPHPQKPANHATVEIRNHGEFFCPLDNGRSSCQLDYAVSFLHEARIKAGSDHLIVLAFIHGNENNATESSDNYPRFEQLISCLNLGGNAYKTQYKSLMAVNTDIAPREPRYVTCDGVEPPNGVRYAGVYIGWQGALFPPPVNLQQNAAMRIGKHRAIVTALYALRNAAKEDFKVTNDKAVTAPAHFIVIGHSFGGLLLEQAAIQIYQSAYKKSVKSNLINCSATVGPKQGLKPFTDLVITINEAVNSVPAMHLIEAFQGMPDRFCHSDQLAPSVPLPLLVSLHSKSDFFTGALGTTIRILAPPRGGLDLGDLFTHPHDWYLYTHSTPANLTGFQNLCYIDAASFGDGGYLTGDRGGYCDAIAHVTNPSDISGSTLIAAPRFASAFPGAAANRAASHLYVRFHCEIDHLTDCAANDLSRRNDAPLLTWNNTPYWMMSIDDNVISGHNDLWSSKIVELVLDMSNVWSAEGKSLTTQQILD